MSGNERQNRGRCAIEAHRAEESTSVSAAICIQLHQKWRAFHRSSENFNSLLTNTADTADTADTEIGRPCPLTLVQKLNRIIHLFICMFR